MCICAETSRFPEKAASVSRRASINGYEQKKIRVASEFPSDEMAFADVDFADWRAFEIEDKVAPPPREILQSPSATMIKLILVSSEVIWNPQEACPRPGIVQGLKEATADGAEIFLVSMHKKPLWLEQHFDFIRFCPCSPKDRKSGKIVDELIQINTSEGLKKSGILVLGAKDADFFMAVNNQALLVTCEWVPGLEEKIKNYGIGLASAHLVGRLVKLLRSTQPWYFRSESGNLGVYSLTNAGTIGVTDLPSLNLINQLRDCLKSGNEQRKAAFNVHLLSSLNVTEEFRNVRWWACYPGSDSSNDGTEVMDDFVNLARETFKRRTRGPIFIRHTPAAKRHLQQRGEDRTDPSSQIGTICINPEYRGKLEGTTVAVLDDYLTYGVSFGVASALLRKAGVERILAVSMGKFGAQARFYNIEVQQHDVYKPITNFESSGNSPMGGHHESQAQLEFVNKFTSAMR